MIECQPVRAGIFLTHGEEQARAALRDHLIAAGLAGDLIHRPALDEAVALARAAPASRQRLLHRVDERELIEDWHNAYARLLLALGPTLERLPDDGARRDLLRRLHELLPHQA